MRGRTLLIISSVAVALVVAALVWSAGHDERLSSFSIDVDPGPTVVGALRPGQQACQGPIRTLGPIGYVTSWVTPVSGPGPALTVAVRDAGSGQTLGSSRVSPGYVGASAPEALLDHVVPAGRTVSVCLRSEGPGVVKLIGNKSNTRSGHLVIAGQLQQESLALYFLRAHPVSLLSQIPVIFRRAALFRPGWVGSWTFWVLAALLLGTFGLTLFAVAQAEREDARSSERISAQ